MITILASYVVGKYMKLNYDNQEVHCNSCRGVSYNFSFNNFDGEHVNCNICNSKQPTKISITRERRFFLYLKNL